MNPLLASNLDWTFPAGISWLAAYAGFLGAGCGIICLVGLILLLREALDAMHVGGSAPATWQAEFMGYGVAKEKYRPRPASRARHSSSDRNAVSSALLSAGTTGRA